METKQKSDYTNDAVNRLQNQRSLLYMNKSNRDRAFLLVKKAGLKARRTSVRGQRIHPEYIEDYSGTIETGFGNTMYESSFSILYKLEIKNEYDGRMK